MREENLRAWIHLRQELSQDHSKLGVSDLDATGAVAKKNIVAREKLAYSIQMRQELSHQVQECLQ